MKTAPYPELIELLADAGQELRESKEREELYYQALTVCAYRYGK